MCHNATILEFMPPEDLQVANEQHYTGGMTSLLFN